MRYLKDNTIILDEIVALSELICDLCATKDIIQDEEVLDRVCTQCPLFNRLILLTKLVDGETQ